MKLSTIKYVIRDTSSYKVIATIKPYRLLTAKERLNILDTRGYSTDEKERFMVDRYLDNKYIFTSFLPTEEEARKEEEEPTLEEPDFDNLDGLEEEDTKATEEYDNLDNLPDYDNLRCLELLND